MIPIVTPAEMREIDARAPESLDVLIARAAWQVARDARSLLGGTYGRRVIALAGKGNNGADAKGAVEQLNRWGCRAQVMPADSTQLPSCDLVIDGAYGTGANRPYTPPAVDSSVPVLAVDIPSGVDGLTGAISAEPLLAQHTTTFAALKPGLLLQPGASYAGNVRVADIGLAVDSATAFLFTESDARRLTQPRSADSHKWKHAVYVVGGSAGMLGAPALAANAALRAGAGMAWCGLPDGTPPAVPSEIVFRPLPATEWAEAVLADHERFGSVAVGCGLGRSAAAQASLTELVDRARRPVVVDADGLRLLGLRPSLRPNIVLTPHDGEYESLMGHRPGSDRFAAARELAEHTNAVVLLKGPATIVADPTGRCVASTSGDARLATAGTGDVLTGVIAALLAAGHAPIDAASLGAWVHGKAVTGQPQVGMVASDLLGGIARILSDLVVPGSEGDHHATN